MSKRTKYLLDESKLPKAWYNINADVPVPPAPILNPQTLEPVTPEFLNVLFPMNLIGQAISSERWIEIPEPVRDIYRLWRPTPLHRAWRLEQALDTPAHIYYKYEGANPVGSHKPNTAVAQAFFCKEEGVNALTTETGAGQWGSALAMACNFFDLDLEIYMVKVSYQQKPYRRVLMENYGATVYPSPTERTQYGRKLLAEYPDSPGSLGIAISEAVEAAVMSGGAKKYSLGSVFNHVLLHQTVIGQEALQQMELADEYPDIVIGCAGGGSNFAGLAFPFVHLNFTEGKKTRILAIEPASCPTLTRGRYTYDFGIHAGGLRYHGMSPIISALVDHGDIEARAVHQLSTFEAAVDFSRAEGIIPAPESAHAIRAAIDEALVAKEAGEKKVILFNLSGHGHFDMAAYDDYHQGKLHDYEYPQEEIEKAMGDLPQVG